MATAQKFKLQPQDFANLMTLGGSSIGNTADAGWHIDAINLCRAKVKLDIELTIMFRFTGGYSTPAIHRVETYGNRAWHKISLSQRAGVFTTNRALWRMLAHCHQAEQWAKETGDTQFLFYYKADKRKRVNELFADQLANDMEDSEMWLATF